jgi:hypothetical protein
LSQMYNSNISVREIYSYLYIYFMYNIFFSFPFSWLFSYFQNIQVGLYISNLYINLFLLNAHTIKSQPDARFSDMFFINYLLLNEVFTCDDK